MSGTSLNYDMLSRQQNGRLTPLILGGPPGAGKTHAAMSLRNNLGEPFARIAAAGKTKEDFTTYPIPEQDKETGIWKIAQPITESSLLALLEVNIKDGFGVLLVDDVTAADPSVQSALLEIAQFGKIGEHQLGKNVAIVFTGNGVSDGAYAAQWSSALINRCHYVEFRASLDVWKELDENANIDPVVYGFLEANPQFFAPEVTNAEDKKKCFDDKGRGPSARQWTTLANSTVEKWGGMAGFKPSVLWKSLQEYCASLVGSQTATPLMTYATMMLKYPTAKALMDDPSVWDRVSDVDKNQAGAIFAVAHSLRQYVTQVNDQINEKYQHKYTSKAVEQEKDALLDKFCHATAKLMHKNREMGAFIVRYVLQKCPADDCIKGQLADYVWNLDDKKPALVEAKFGDILDNIKEMNEGLDKR
jgi:DNA polymerase III delta prime subunit